MPYTHLRRCSRRYRSRLIQRLVVSVVMLYDYLFIDSLVERARHYVWPEQTKETIRTTIKNTIRDSPLVLIDASSGRLCNKLEQAAAFESTPAFAKLVASMTTHIDHALIEKEVWKFYRYATFSHTWEDNEPLFEQVIRIVVYDLGASRTHDKLQMFCKIVREAGFNWAWSDTCCIDKVDHFVLQEALVSMFKWYERSAMTIIFLRGVHRLALRGALMNSIWNTRGWTLQEYHASKVVRFYTEDWTPYLGLDIYNHKDSPEIISEMEEATGISARALMELRPGLDDIREKLHLASTRQTTRVEDAAYSLLGIFSLSLPILYGEGDKALGKLLAQLLTSSGDVGILAWTGRSGSFNSCLPASITVFSELPITHLPSDVPDAEMRTITTGFRSHNLTLATSLYSRVSELPVPSFSGRRMKLPCFTFKLGPLSIFHDGSGRIFRAQTNSLGVVAIRTGEDLSQLGSLYLIHPWIDFLLNRQPVGNVIQTITEEHRDDQSSALGDLPSLPGPSHTASTQKTRTARLMSRIGRSFGDHSSLDVASLRPPSTVSPMEKQTLVLQFIARLRRPFGALLFTPTRHNVDEYKRVAAGSLIRVQVEELTPAILEKLTNSVRVLDVL